MMRWIPVVLLTLTVTAACGQEADTGSPPAAEEASPAAEETLPADCEETSDLTMVGSEFEPRCLITSDPVVTVANEDLVLHSFTIRGADLDLDIEDGESVEIDVSGAVEEGVLTEFYCKYHAPMVGDLLLQ